MVAGDYDCCRESKLTLAHQGNDEEMTNKIAAILRASLVFDEVTRIGPTTLRVSVWNYDPAAKAGFEIECKLGVSL